MSKVVQTEIELAQPYNRPNPIGGPSKDSMWLLHELDATDKHKFLIVGTFATTAFRTWFVPRYPRRAIQSTGSTFAGWTVDVVPGGPFKDGAILAQTTVHPPDAQVRMRPKVTYGIAFDGGPAHGLEATAALEQILVATRHLLRHFETKFFPACG